MRTGLPYSPKLHLPTSNELSEWLPLLTRSERETLDSLLLANRLPTLLEFLQQTISHKLHQWQAEYLTPLLESLVYEVGLRLLIHGPPQYGKSLPTSKRFPAYVLGVDPLRRILVAGYNQTHAQTQFAEPVRDVMLSDLYKELFPNPDCRIPERASTEAFSTFGRSRLNDGQDSLVAVGLQSGYTGKGLARRDILLIDDPYASPEDAVSVTINDKTDRFWTDGMSPRVDPEANVLSMFHRYQPDDFAGRRMAEGGWRYFRFPAVADDNEDGSDPTGREIGELLSVMRTREWLEAQRDRNPMVFLGQFQGVPRAPEGTLIKRDWLKKEPACPKLDRWVRFWDLSTFEARKKSKRAHDFFVGALVGIGPDHTVWVRDIVRFRAEWPEAAEIIAETTQRDFEDARLGGYDYHAGVEKVAWQLSMIQDLFIKAIFEQVSLWALDPKGKKADRASGWIARARMDKFRLVDAPSQNWIPEFIAEALAFRGVETDIDDQIDGVSGGYDLLWRLRGGTLENERPIDPNTWEYFDRLDEQSRRAAGSDAEPDFRDDDPEDYEIG